MTSVYNLTLDHVDNRPCFTHTVNQGDTLSEIAYQFFGNAAACESIRHLNSKNDADIKAGDKLIIRFIPKGEFDAIMNSLKERIANDSEANGMALMTELFLGRLIVDYVGSSIAVIMNKEFWERHRRNNTKVSA